MSDVNRELADFLRRSRSQIDPLATSLPADGRVRRVPGLRREEVARLAGVSTDYYTRLEQGRPITPSPGVLDAVARALDLDEVGRAHLGHLVGGPGRRAPRTAAYVQRVRPGLHQLLEAMDQPAMVLGRRTDVLATNLMARALICDFDRLPATQRCYARWMFLDDRARALFLDWEEQARNAVENLRFDVGDDTDNRATADLVAELSAKSARFRTWWGEHRVYQRTFGSKRLHHPLVGDLTVDYETFSLPGDPDQTLFVYSTKAGTSSRHALDLLTSWSQPTTPTSANPAPARATEPSRLDDA